MSAIKFVEIGLLARTRLFRPREMHERGNGLLASPDRQSAARGILAQRLHLQERNKPSAKDAYPVSSMERVLCRKGKQL